MNIEYKYLGLDQDNVLNFKLVIDRVAFINGREESFFTKEAEFKVIFCEQGVTLRFSDCEELIPLITGMEAVDFFVIAKSYIHRNLRDETSSLRKAIWGHVTTKESIDDEFDKDDCIRIKEELKALTLKGPWVTPWEQDYYEDDYIRLREAISSFDNEIEF